MKKIRSIVASSDHSLCRVPGTVTDTCHLVADRREAPAILSHLEQQKGKPLPATFPDHVDGGSLPEFTTARMLHDMLSEGTMRLKR